MIKRILHLIVLLAALCPADVWAQLPKNPGQPPAQTSYLAYILALVAVVAVCAAAFLPSWRTHQD